MAVSVKDFLDAIRGRYQDEANKVELTGSNARVLIKNLTSERLRNNVDSFFGENNDGFSSVQTLDISKYKNIFIRVRNNHSSQITVMLQAYQESKVGAGGRLDRFSEIDLPAGAVATFSSHDTNDLKLLYPSIVINTEVSSPLSDSGDVSVMIFGGVI